MAPRLDPNSANFHPPCGTPHWRLADALNTEVNRLRAMRRRYIYSLDIARAALLQRFCLGKRQCIHHTA